MRIIALILGTAFLVAVAQAQQPAPLVNPTGPAPAAVQGELPADATVDQVLDALDLRGKSMYEFTAKVSLTSGDKLVGDLNTRVGHIALQKKGEDDGRLRVTFEKRLDGQISRDEKMDYLLDNGWLVERDYRKKAETRHEVVKPGEKINLLKLDEGPFPLLIGQNKDDVKKLFDVIMVPIIKEKTPELADSIHIRLTPKDGTRFARKFGSIDIWVGRKSNFPIRIDTTLPDGSDKRITKLEDLKVNPAPALKQEDFTLDKIDPQVWSLHTNSYRD